MWWEVRYLIAAPALLWLYWQYAVVYQCMNRARYLTAVIWLPLGIAFAVQNVIFNATVGSFIFWDRPREWFFSDRIRAMTCYRKERFKRLLNAHDRGHIA